MNRGTQKLSYNVKANEWQHKKFDPKSNFTAAPQAIVVDEQGLKYRKLQTCKRVMVGGVKTPIVPGNTTADYSALTAYKDDSSYGGTCNQGLKNRKISPIFRRNIGYRAASKR